MTYTEDPDFRQLRLEFLRYIRRFHAQHSYTTDWRRICESLGIGIDRSSADFHGTFRKQSLISVDASVSRTRQDYTGWHELCHHLCETADEGFRALLEDRYGLDVARELEEDLCHEGAGILLVPDHVLEAGLRQHGYHPEAVFALTARMGSVAACLMRLILSTDLDAWGLTMTPDGLVEFSCTSTQFSIWKGHRVEADHVIHQAWHGSVERQAAIPYHSGSRVVKLPMRAASRGQRVVALFCRTFPTFPNAHQGSLFS